MSFCVAKVGLRDIPTCFMTCQKWFCVVSAILLPRFSQDALHFSWQAQHFGDLQPHFAWQAQHFRQVNLHVFLRIAVSELREVLTTCKTVAGKGLHLQLHTLYLILRTLHPTLHCTLYMLHSTLNTPHCTLHTLSTLYNLQCALHTPHLTLYTPHSTLYTAHLTLHT